MEPAVRESRLLDAALALAGIVVFGPLFAAAAALILAEDGPPVLFRQWRIGRRGIPFRILKFRTMRSGTDGPSITARGDPRITRTGAWLRAFKLDELPQLLNVLSGSMSLIGPRPEVPEYVRPEDEHWRRVLEFRPGITDLASLAYRDEESILAGCSDRDTYYRCILLPEKLRLNIEYQESRCFTTDLKLLWMTARYSVLPRGFSRERVLTSLARRTGRHTQASQGELHVGNFGNRFQ